MLEQVAKHGGFNLELKANGDVEVDDHHLIEDTAIALGEALKDALGNKWGINRYGFTVPMDESLASIAIDIGGRGFCVFQGQFTREFVGGMATEMVPHFFNSLANALGATIHIEVRGQNHHHMIEACFKSLGRALGQACAKTNNFYHRRRGSMIAIVDVSGTNLTSLANALHRLGFNYQLTHDAQEIRNASHVILPGVGTASYGMNALRQYDLVDVLTSLEQPLLGICLGMQLLLENSEEGNVQCLGLIPGQVRRLPRKKAIQYLTWAGINCNGVKILHYRLV